MNKDELMSKIKALDLGKWTDYKATHIKIDDMLYEYIGFTEDDIKIINSLCPLFSRIRLS